MSILSEEKQLELLESTDPKALEGADFYSTSHRYRVFTQDELCPRNLKRIDLRSSRLRGSVFDHTYMVDAKLDGAYALDTSFRFANLTGASLVEAELSGSMITCASLDEADLRGVKMRESDLRATSFRGADLTNADLSGSNLSLVDFTGATLDGVNLSNSNIVRCAGLKAYSVTWPGHGQVGRKLIGAELEEHGLTFFCGCFKGSEKELRDFIADDAECYAETRLKALNYILQMQAHDYRTHRLVN